MAKIVILGAGVMGSAFSLPLSDAGQQVRLVGTHLDRAWIEAIRRDGVHPKLNATLPENVVPFTYDQLGEALGDNTDLIVLGVSSPGVDWAIRQLGPLLKKPIPILMLTKGLLARDNRLHILPDVVCDGLAEYGVKGVPVGAVGGPCLARELAVRHDCCVVITYRDQTLLDWVLSLVNVPYYHTQSSTDIIGVEACAALKNFYALAITYPRGLSEKIRKANNEAQLYSLESGLFTLVMTEMRYMVKFLGGTDATVDGWAGSGDLYGTCQIGRNGRMGRLLGFGLPYKETKAKYMPDDTVEGADVALTIGATVEYLIEHRHLDGSLLPLTRTIIAAICHDHPMEIPWIQVRNYKNKEYTRM
ncbi:putative NAD-dependent glycerol-3-phosphate dehydrogenase [Candidatus Vecturithrix granuli]|uniref:Glycerol-3-phosphate dehydrogenase n=1 Tax=Vecturithrix granuli TaxID=1499967 RepID=A0A0S6WB91_VECG1|nr:putative NAD-dependent glycerol-3-phosphate dehydrogenase [Candidatus Vecturithrix granuli]